MTDRAGVYVVRMRSGNENYYYVGKSNDVSKRLQQHERMGSMCAAWVKKHGGVVSSEDPLTPPSELNSWEQQETLARMLKHGFEKVRGWEFTRCSPLESHEYKMIKTLVMGMGDLCRKCGHPGHFVNQCPNPEDKAQWLRDCETNEAVKETGTCKGVIASIIENIATAIMPRPSKRQRQSTCMICHRTNHVSAECTATTFADGTPMFTEYISSSDDDDDVCSRCGRYTHTSNECYARRTIDGAEL